MKPSSRRSSRPRLRVLVVGCGQMGTSHARAYHTMKRDFDIVGVVSRGPESRTRLAAEVGTAAFADFRAALRDTRPDVVCISTYPESHAPLARMAFEAGCHVFMEKPLATDQRSAEAVVAAARRSRRQLMVGYILQVHPAWLAFVSAAQQLGSPLVMRMCLNQRSVGDAWRIHRELLKSATPLIDCGVHYVEVMCRMTGARATHVSAIGARLSDEIGSTQTNYGQLQVRFSDGSVGWYEAGWGPMMSETACFVKDAIGPRGSASLVTPFERGRSADISAHTEGESLYLHSSQPLRNGQLRPERRQVISDVPDHDELCRREQERFLHAIRNNTDLRAHHQSALDSLAIVLAADKSARTGRVVRLRS